MTESNQDQSLINFVTELQSLNDLDVDILQKDIEEIIDDPEQYGNDLIEIQFAKNVKLFLDAYKLGNEFGKELIKNAK